MDAQSFIQRIQGTPFFTEEQKVQILNMVETFDAEKQKAIMEELDGMDLFCKRIKNTALLADEQKEKYIANIMNYTPEARKNMIEALMEQEKVFVNAVGEEKQRIAKEDFLQLMKRQEEAQKRDLAEADRLLAEIMNS